MQLEFLYPPEFLSVMPILLPVIFAVLVVVLSEIAMLLKRPLPHGLPDVIAILGFTLSFLGVFHLGLEVMNNGVQTYTWSGLGGSVGVVLAVDMFTVLMMGLFCLMGFVVSIYSIDYMRHESGIPLYYILVLIMIAGMNGVVCSGDLFTLFLFYETMGICSFVLVAFKRNWEGIEAAIKYLMMSAIGSTLVLFAASYLYGLTGTLNLGAMSNAIRADPSHPLLPVLVALLIAGFGVKGAIVPFSAWLADAHPAAPSGISALLSGVVIKVGIYGIIRVNTLLFPTNTVYFDWQFLVAIFSLVTMTAGNFWALTQTDLKRMLAYSSIAQIGFILYAFGTATELGFQTGAFYIVTHALTKGLLFLCAGAFLHAVGTRDLDTLRGIGRRMPVTAGFFVVGVLSLMGMPPLAGFHAKFLILLAGMQVGVITNPYYFGVTLGAVFNALLALGYYLRMMKTVWFEPQSERASTASDHSPSMLFALAILGIALIVIGVYPAPIFTIAEAAGSALFDFGSLVTGILSAGTP